MNKSELVSDVARRTGMARRDAQAVVDATLGSISQTLKRGGDVSITGFGKFSVVKRAARKGVNPRTGESLRIRAVKSPKFTAGATLKEVVRGTRKAA
jgi:DNA-binding protein HU-beta